MKHILKLLCSKFSDLNDQRSLNFEKAVLKLELIYQRSLASGKPTIRDSLSTPKHILAAHLFTPDLYFLVIGMTFITLTSGSIIVPGPEYGPLRLYMIAVGFIVGVLSPFLMAPILLPFNLLLSIPIYALTLIDTLLAALLVSFAFPIIAFFFFGDPVFTFSKLFFPMLAIYGFSSIYMMLRVSNYVCYYAYKKRHAANELSVNLPPNKRGKLISLSAQDHYVEITTSEGSHLQRMSITNAINAAPEGAGMKVHRSHWVAYRQILFLEEVSGRFFVVLRNGTKKPVSKINVDEVRKVISTHHQS